MIEEEKEMISCPACGHVDYEEKFKVSEKMAKFTNTYEGELVCPRCRKRLSV